MRVWLGVTLLAMSLLIGLATFHRVNRGSPRDCPPPSARSVEDLFAPCLAQERREEIETTGRR
jgi:hypothetical protein